jgi:hypothetical protein
MRLLTFPADEIQEELCLILRETCLSHPTWLSRLSHTFLMHIDRQKHKLGIGEDSQAHVKLSKIDMIHIRGLTNAISALLAIVNDRPLYLPYEVVGRAWDLAIRIFGKLSTDTSTVNAQLETSWSLLSGIMCLREPFVKMHMENITTLWRNIFISGSPGGSLARSAKQEQDWLFFLKARDFAMQSVCIFLHKCHRIINDNLIDSISNFINGCFIFISQRPSYLKYDTYYFEACLLHCLSVLPRSAWDRGTLPIHGPIMDAILESNSISALFDLFINEMDVVFLGGEMHAVAAPIIPPAPQRDLFPWFKTSTSDHRDHVCSRRRDSLKVDYAIEAFAKTFITQGEDYRIQLWSTLIEELRNVKLARKRVLQANVLTIILVCFSHLARKRILLGPEAHTIVLEFLESIVSHQDPHIRYAASRAYGLVASCISIVSVENLISLNIHRIAEERETYKRAGCVLSLGNIMKCMGNMGRSAYLAKIIKSFQWASLDPSPIVCRSALLATRITLESTGGLPLSVSNSVLALVIRFFLSSYTNNADPELQVLIGQSISFLVSSMGPELWSNPKLAEFCLTVCDDLRKFPFIEVKVELLACLRYFALTGSRCINLDRFLSEVVQALESSDPRLCQEALLCTHQLSQTMPQLLLEKPYRVDMAILRILNHWDNPLILEEAKHLLHYLLVNTIKERHHQWFRVLSDIILRPYLLTQDTQNTRTIEMKVQETYFAGHQSIDDEESAQPISFPSIDSPQISTTAQPRNLAREGSIAYALDCLQILLKETNFKDLDQDNIRTLVPDLLRCAVSAVTSFSNELQLKGLIMLNHVLHSMKDLRDPDDPSSYVLEEYGAFVLTALSPAFSSVSDPFIMAKGCEICVRYIDSILPTKKGDIHRVLRLLAQSLDRLQGDIVFADMCPLAYAMMKQAVLCSWADLYVKFHDINETFSRFFDPFLPSLNVLWLANLHHYAELRLTDVFIESKMTSTNFANLTESQFRLSFSKAFLFEYYDVRWINILEALVTLSFHRPDLVNFALKSASVDKEATRNFYLLMGLCVEEISGNDIERSNMVQRCLGVLQRLLNPSVVGGNGLKGEIFLELLECLYSLQTHFTGSVASSAIDLLSTIYHYSCWVPKDQVESDGQPEPNRLHPKLILNAMIILGLTFGRGNQMVFVKVSRPLTNECRRYSRSNIANLH